jgi:Glycosyltransferase
MKVLWVFNHPAPYKIDFFNLLGQKCDLTVLFERQNESDRNAEFYYAKATNFTCRVLKGIILGTYNNFTNEVVSEIATNKYDLIVMNGYSTLTEMKAISFLHKKQIPYIFAVNGGIIRDKESGIRRGLKRKYISGAAKYLAPDPNSANYLRFYGADEKLIGLYPYSTVFASEVLTSPVSHDEQMKLRQEEGIEGEKVFVSVGQFVPRKNNFTLLSLWKQMPKDYTLILVGNGSEKSDYQQFVRENGLSNVLIKNYEPHEKILKTFRLADFSLFLTKEDIYGHVVNESLSQGTPVIASPNANSSLNLIANGKNGFLVSLDRPDSIVDALKALTNEALRIGAIETAKENTIEKMVERHLMVFQEVLGK